MNIDYAVLAAMPEELDYINYLFADDFISEMRLYHFICRVYHYGGKKILVAYTGIGTGFASSVITLVNHCVKPKGIFLCGTAGAVKSHLHLRDVVVAEYAFEAEMQSIYTSLENTPFASCLTHPLNRTRLPPTYSANDKLMKIASRVDLKNIVIHRGTVVSSNTFPAPKALFEKIKSQGVYAIDMETSAAYQTAWLLNIPLLSIRGISNILNHDGTDDKIQMADVKGSAEAACKVLLKTIDLLSSEKRD